MSDGGFARIDPISNHTVFKVPGYYADLIKRRDLPVRTFSTFIHEATHHWCFTSPLGMGLMLLYLSVARKALRWGQADEAARKEAINDLRTYQLVISVLRPLNEGMAQFAEYDALPPAGSKLISPPMLAAVTFLFNYPDRASKAKDREHRVWYEISDEIKRWRLSRETIERKSELLLQPIGSGSLYLPGYLAVKQIWRSITRDYEELQDADVFLIFLRRLIYADHSLVAEFLDREKTPEDRALGFTKGLQQRLSLIYLGFVADHMTWKEWEELLEPPEPGLRGVTNPFDGLAHALLDNQAEVAKGQDLRLKFIDEVLVPLGPGPGEGDPFPDDYFLNLVEERPLMWLGDLQANWIGIGERKGRIVRGDDVIFDNYALTNGPKQISDELTLDLYIDLYENLQLTTVRDGNNVFGFAMRDDVPTRMRERWMKARMDRPRLATLTERVHSAVRPLLDPSDLDLIAKFWEKDENPTYDRSMLGFAFNFNAEAREAITKQGIAGVLENNADLVRNVAAITLGASAGLSPERLAELSEVKLQPMDTIARVSKRWKFKKLPMACIGEDGFLQSVF